jgi:ribosome-binding protein aMBF1 (putative translation factor)
MISIFLSYFGIFRKRFQHHFMRLVRDREKTLRERLKKARLAAGLRQVDVAQQLAKPQSYIAKIENGERKTDFIEVLDICVAIGLDPCELTKELAK